MHQPREWHCIALFLLWVGSAQAYSNSLCDDSDKACQFKAISTQRIITISEWERQLSKPIRERIGSAPESLVEYITLGNQLGGFAERPMTASPDASFLADVDTALAELPPQVLRLLDKRLAGVEFVSNLGSTGFSNYVNDATGKPIAVVVTLDAGVLQGLTANRWATWKENTPFKPEQGYALEVQIESVADDNRKNAIQYLLLHEFAHVISVGQSLHPNWNIQPRQLPSSKSYPYFDSTWFVDQTNNKYRSKFDEQFVQRKDVVYYLKPRLSGADMEATYRSLEQTNFPSLYGATNPGDDFAEAFVTYVHVVKMHRPWTITIQHAGTVLKTIQTCWDEARCASKRALLEAILDNGE